MPSDEHGQAVPPERPAPDGPRDPWLALTAGEVLSNRFAIEQSTGAGGMGTIYRATDLETQSPVAIKVMAWGDTADDDAARFAEEAAVLASLSHPGIVRYIAHGTTRAGTPYLAMQWLDGEDLGGRLLREPLRVDESLALIRRACEALAAAHSRGVVHRDIKPSNLFLVNRDPNALAVIDFGIARTDRRAVPLTRTGIVLGTVGYMAPEQALGQRDLDARVDVFSLGCVLYECLSGHAPFRGKHAVAVLAKVLRDDPVRVSETRPELGRSFDRLLARMLAKDRIKRPQDANAVLAALDEVSVQSQPGSQVWSVPGGLTNSEQRVVTVILGQPANAALEVEGDTMVANVASERRMIALAESFGAELMPLRGGALFAILSGSGAAVDQAVQAARYAMALLRLRQGLRIGIATGRAETTRRGPVGEAIDRASVLVGDKNAGAGVVLDELTASLLGPHFETARSGAGVTLLRERGGFDAPPLLMGKPTPCVGREKELGTLELTLAECVRDDVSRAVLVTAPSGVGKSRLASEFVAAVRAKGSARVLFARADPMATRSALSVAQELVRCASRVRSGEEFSMQRERLRDYLATLVSDDALERACEFLSEMIGISTGSNPSPFLRAARNDAAVMSEQTRRAFASWIDAESTLGPLVLLLEDVHWADAPTITFLEQALRRLSDRPLMLLALGRPEVHDVLPQLRSQELQEIKLGGLTRRAAERLVRASLGAEADHTIVTRIVERADGNAFFLEELIRGAAEGGDTELPETVRIMVQSRLERLEPDARRVLRAASVYGERCWHGGLSALLGNSDDTRSWLEYLSDREILIRVNTARFPGEREYAFRHALLREGAYAMLTEQDRTSAHRGAGEWLEHAGEKDPWILADHFQRGAERDKSIAWLVQAALRAMDRGDLAGAFTLAERGEALGASGPERGALLVARASNLGWSGESTVQPLEEAVSLLPEGSTFWWSAVGFLIWQMARAGEPARAAPYVTMALRAPLGPALSGPHGQTLAISAFGLWAVGHTDAATSFIDKFERAALSDPSCDPVVLGWVRLAQSTIVSLHEARPESLLERAEESLQIMQEAGALLGVALAYLRLGTALHLVFGAVDEAEGPLTKCLRLALDAGNRLLETNARLFLAGLDVSRGRTQAALAVLLPLERSTDTSIAQRARLFAMQAYVKEGRRDAALERAELLRSAQTPWIRPLGVAVVANIISSEGRADEALAMLDAVEAEPAYGARTFVQPNLTIARAEALHAAGRRADALAVVTALRAQLLETAAKLENPDLKHAFLSNVEPHVRAFALAQAWS